MNFLFLWVASPKILDNRKISHKLSAGDRKLPLQNRTINLIFLLGLIEFWSHIGICVGVLSRIQAGTHNILVPEPQATNWLINFRSLTRNMFHVCSSYTCEEKPGFSLVYIFHLKSFVYGYLLSYCSRPVPKDVVAEMICVDED